MYSKMVPISMFIVLLAVYSVEQPSATKCYTCDSSRDGLCWAKPARAYVVECKSRPSKGHSTVNSTLLAVVAELIGGNVFMSKDWVLRTPSYKDVPCALYRKELAHIGFKVNSCTRCNNDLCNTQKLQEIN